MDKMCNILANIAYYLDISNFSFQIPAFGVVKSWNV